jgi:hypothetical protein
VYLLFSWQQFEVYQVFTCSFALHYQVVMSHSQQGEWLNMVSSQNTAQSAGWPIGDKARPSIPLAVSRIFGGFMDQLTLPGLNITTAWKEHNFSRLGV